MTTKNKAACGSANYQHAKMSTAQDTAIIQQQFERGSMIAAIVMALFFGAAMLMWAVCAV